MGATPKGIGTVALRPLVLLLLFLGGSGVIYFGFYVGSRSTLVYRNAGHAGHGGFEEHFGDMTSQQQDLKKSGQNHKNTPDGTWEWNDIKRRTQENSRKSPKVSNLSHEKVLKEAGTRSTKKFKLHFPFVFLCFS